MTFSHSATRWNESCNDARLRERARARTHSPFWIARFATPGTAALRDLVDSGSFRDSRPIRNSREAD
jgi:hypothetical protein